MNLRHATALALVGWYLIAPPPKQSPTSGAVSLDVSAPLAKWQRIDSFDTAAECRAAQAKTGVVAIEPDDIAILHDGDEEWWAKNAKTRIAASKCIARDDPRLKGK